MNEHVSRAGRKEQIARALMSKSMEGKGAIGTMHWIAKRIGMKPSSHLMSILKEMYLDGDLSIVPMKGRSGRWDGKGWRLVMPSKYIKQRQININSKGLAIAQFEMFS